MKEHPILFSGSMIRSILEGGKLQTRRVVTTTRSWIKFYSGDKAAATKAFHEDASIWNCGGEDGNHWQESDEWTLQNYQEGDRLWVRETWQSVAAMGQCHKSDDYVVYRADDPDWETMEGWRWKPSIFMPRWASRITLEITQVRVERLQDISEVDSKAEGVQSCWSDDQGETPGRLLFFTDADSKGSGHSAAKESYQVLWDWDSINGKKHPWSSNPWVWAITFRKL